LGSLVRGSKVKIAEPKDLEKGLTVNSVAALLRRVLIKPLLLLYSSNIKNSRYSQLSGHTHTLASKLLQSGPEIIPFKTLNIYPDISVFPRPGGSRFSIIITYNA
jgi:hypothetical protein